MHLEPEKFMKDPEIDLAPIEDQWIERQNTCLFNDDLNDSDLQIH